MTAADLQRQAETHVGSLLPITDPGLPELRKGNLSYMLRLFSADEVLPYVRKRSIRHFHWSASTRR